MDSPLRSLYRLRTASGAYLEIECEWFPLTWKRSGDQCTAVQRVRTSSKLFSLAKTKSDGKSPSENPSNPA